MSEQPPNRGERGPVGDHGQTGLTGGSGQIGERGQTGQDGERGQTGDAGSKGETGQQGRAGMIGQQGVIGERGKTGDHGQSGDNAPPMLSRLQVLVLFLFVVLVFALQTWRSERNDDKIAENTRKIDRVSRVACERANQNTETINEFLDLLIANIKTIDTYTAAEKAQRIVGYEQSKRPVINCD